jgi:hypothetical protein
MATDSDTAEYFSCEEDESQSDENLGLSGYLFEPEPSSDEDENNDDIVSVDHEEATRIGNTDW